jgi:hypothetical protein
MASGAAAVALLLSLCCAASGSAAVRHCTITGTPGHDVLRGTPADDVICARGGNDVIRGGGGDDVLLGGRGEDRIQGDAGDDRIVGGPGADVLLGGEGDNTIDRHANDRLGDYQLKFVVIVHGAKDHQVTVSEGSDSYCTKDESHGTYTPDSDNWSLELVMTIKVFGGCFIQLPYNSWMFSVAGEDLGQVKGHENWAHWEWECMPGIWPRARCEGDRAGIDVWL